MNKTAQIRGSLLSRNTLLNFIGQAVHMLASIITIPFIVRGLGIERFGLLSLVWVIFGYFAIFDLGIGRATTKFVAEALGKGEENEIPHLVWIAVTIQVILGIVGALALIGITPLLVERILKIPSDLIGEAKATFYVLALSLPVVFISGSFRGLLEAVQRFDLVNAVTVPASVLNYILTLIGIGLSLKLPGIVALILFSRFGVLAAFVMLNLRIMPWLRKYSVSFSLFSLFPRLFSFGGWVTVSGIVGPILVYLDRFLIGALISMSAVAYYTASYEAVTRLWIIPSSLVMALFPAFSALEGMRDRERLQFFFIRSVKYIFLTLGLVVLIISLFAKEILQIWLGVDFAMKSEAVLQILALAVLINSLAHFPFALLQGIGRPDLLAKFHLLELPIYVGMAGGLVKVWGITGAALAWTL
ncbi:flippase [Thermodesulfovibrio sp. 3462-1]|uniref:Flippase n=1 Tax=Thermodesulfovibrio obliviosus TaxID=3118332 RepID=A0AAU8H530_9BACT